MDERPQDVPPSSPTKVDPETLVLRAQPSSVVRVRRGAVIGAAALGSLALVGVTWIALKPATLRIVAEGQGPDLRANEPIDALADAPAGYDEVPQLGPPLPGDLGRPILARQREIEGAQMPVAAEDHAAQAAEAARLQAAAEEKAARESGVLMQLTNAAAPPASPATPTGNAELATLHSETLRPDLDPVRDPGHQEHKARFLAVADGSSSILRT